MRPPEMWLKNPTAIQSVADRHDTPLNWASGLASVLWPGSGAGVTVHWPLTPFMARGSKLPLLSVPSPTAKQVPVDGHAMPRNLASWTCGMRWGCQVVVPAPAGPATHNAETHNAALAVAAAADIRRRLMSSPRSVVLICLARVQPMCCALPSVRPL